MNRSTLAVAAIAAALCVAFAGGCSEDANGQKINSPFKKTSASTPAKAPNEANYFELKKDGRTYVFSRIDSMNAFREGRSPAKTSTQELDGKTVVFENRGFTDYNRLVAEYRKAHNVQ